AKTRAKKLGAEAQQAAEQFRVAEARASRAAQRLREVRPTRLRDLEQADSDEQHLKELVRKLAQYKSSLDSDADPENLISESQALAREVEASVNYFGVLGKLEQYSQLKIWIGRFRMYQATNDGELTEENQAQAQRVFHQLKALSKQYEPGYIEAFRHDFHTDW